MQIKTFKTTCKTVASGGRIRGECQTLEDLEEEINDFIWKVKVIDIKHTLAAHDTTFHFFTIMYEEEN